MNQCQLFLIPSLCDLLEHLPRLSREELLSFLLGILIVLFFAIDHYEIPTYAKTTVGDFIELSPKSLTSTRRYRKGLYIYIFLIFALYLAFCFFWSQGFVAILTGFGLQIDNVKLWPIAAATAVTLIGTAGDKNPLGRLEASLRSIAHQAAYIPDAVLRLSSSFSGSFPITPEMTRELGQITPDLLAKITESQDGSVQTWIRTRYLASRLEMVRQDAEFQQLIAKPENIRALEFLRGERDTLTERVSQRLQANYTDLDEPLKKKVESLRNGIAMFLASLLWQAVGTETAIQRKASKLKLAINPVESSLSWEFLSRMLVSLLFIGAISYVGLYLANWQSNEFLSDAFWEWTLAMLILVSAAMFVSRRRESRLEEGTMQSTFNASVGAVLSCGLPIGFGAAIVTFAIFQGGQAQFWSIMLTGLSLSILITGLFEIVMRWAAQSPPVQSNAFPAPDGGRFSSEIIYFAGRAVCLYALTTSFAVFVVFWIGQQLTTHGTPIEQATAANKYLARVLEGFGSTGGALQVDERFSKVDSNRFRGLSWAVNEAESKITADGRPGSIVNRILRECEELNAAFDNKLLLPGCKLNDDYTRTLGGSPWMEAVRESMIRVEQLIPSLQHLQQYHTPISAFRADWKRAAVVSVLWLLLSGTFAGCALIYRRNLLWNSFDTKVLNAYVVDIGSTANEWLRRPISELSGMTPLEALRYGDLRSSLSDYVQALRTPVSDLRNAA